ncbi:nitroreductase/quinone reductase family protein [Rhodococcus sp. NPDC003318]|uniref:nitroreductase/quinone reductase family protein n=1 Tax=Rhodococcus sp. NPDC003318 TaxID=3364503 RepID=UPI0036772A91
MTATRTTTQLRLPGQVAAADGPVDLVGMFVMHHGFRRDLALFDRAVPATPVADRGRWRRMSRRWDLFADVLHKHHSGEDTGLWPLLLARAENADAAAVLHAMHHEHEDIDPCLQACTDGLHTMRRGGSAADRDALSVHVHDLRALLEHHLAHEETEALPLIQQVLTQADWDLLDRNHFAKKYRPSEIPRSLAWVALDLPGDAVARMAGSRRTMYALGRHLGRRLAAADRRTFAAPDSTAAAAYPGAAIALLATRLPALHTALLRRTGGRLGRRFRGSDVLLLTVRGRRSGSPHTVPLLYVRDGDDLVVAASNGGFDWEPQWWRNLRAEPHAVLEIGGRRRPVVAEQLQGDDRAAMWSRLVDQLSAYEDYQARVHRRIAVIRLHPRPDGPVSSGA